MIFYVLIFIVFEVVLAFTFSLIGQLFYQKIGLDLKSIAKGFIERLFLVLGLYFGYPHCLTFFSAIKLATRLKHHEKDQNNENKFNDFYLLGNFISVGMAVLYTEFLKGNISF